MLGVLEVSSKADAGAGAGAAAASTDKHWQALSSAHKRCLSHLERSLSMPKRPPGDTPFLPAFAQHGYGCLSVAVRAVRAVREVLGRGKREEGRGKKRLASFSSALKLTFLRAKSGMVACSCLEKRASVVSFG